MSYLFLVRLLFMPHISYLGPTLLFCWVILCAKKHPASIAWCLLHVTTFGAPLWVSLYFSLLLKPVRITSLAARACTAQVRPSACHALLTHLAAAVTACPKYILCLLAFLPSLQTVSPAWSFRSSSCSCSVMCCHTLSLPVRHRDILGWGPSCSSNQSRWLQMHTFACPPWQSIYLWTAVKGLSRPKWLSGEQLKRLAPIMK